MIDFMTRPKKSAKKAPPKKYTRSRDIGDVVYLGAEVAPEIAKTIGEYCETNGVKKRFVIESALRDWLKSRGMMQP